MERKYGKTFIREWRKYRGLSLRGLADRLELSGPDETFSHASIGRIENGQQPYSQPVLEAISQALDVEVAHLLSTDPTVGGFSETSPDAKLRSSLIAFGVDGDVVEQVVDIVRTFARDEKPEESPSQEQPLPATPRREPARTR
jgi:transcriptional regulator with XRE-family HTH domain